MYLFIKLFALDLLLSNESARAVAVLLQVKQIKWLSVIDTKSYI